LSLFCSLFRQRKAIPTAVFIPPMLLITKELLDIGPSRRAARDGGNWGEGVKAGTRD
jgi:hypothetical protein